ncbi:MAG: AmmeMemoRadiSam system radical SAM enzyme [Candidatus Aminicenantes bacterium]|nr:MAG: AmmeMemoRadiSam system radical SAM enzyme [Candidatus Aminicenantes bacterium]
MKPALLYEKYEKGGGQKVKCLLCPHHCILDDQQPGICQVRQNIKGELYSLNYDRVAATHTDPIEKKPLYHFLPGSTSFSIATMGCNFHCKFCQNHSLSRVEDAGYIYGESISPAQLVKTALRNRSQSISYTYTEPTIYFELMLETAKLAKDSGIKNVMVTNGYMSSKALEMIAPFMDGANVDLKAFTDGFYKKYCGARLTPVLDTIKAMKQKGIWVEVTTLLIPGLNSDTEELKQLISFILSVDGTIPWHVSRFYPQYKLTSVPPTDPGTIFDLLETAKEMGLQYLYAGNVSADRWDDTYCPKCNTRLIQRSGYFTRVLNLSNGKCASCGFSIPGVWR